MTSSRIRSLSKGFAFELIQNLKSKKPVLFGALFSSISIGAILGYFVYDASPEIQRLFLLLTSVN